jgi:methyl-accepting chemotaxis protein
VLFLLLKVRMEPLLSLRSTVAGLAKGVIDLSPRARVKSEDEFGELALDLNHFLDRIALIVHDKMLAEVVTVGTRLGALNRHLELQLDGMRDAALRRMSEGAHRSVETQLVVARELGAFNEQLTSLDEVAASGQLPATAVTPLRGQLTRLRDSFGAVAQALQGVAPPVLLADAQTAEYQAFAQSLREMALLEVASLVGGPLTLSPIGESKNSGSPRSHER